MNSNFIWQFPLPRTHTGMLLGNGTMGAMIWGQDNKLCITLGRADLWDHRGGKPWTDAMNFRDIRKLLEAGDEPELRRIFEDVAIAPGQPPRPTIVPVGRLDLVFPSGVKLITGQLNVKQGTVEISLADSGSNRGTILLEMSMEHPVLLIRLTEEMTAVEVRHVPAWEFVGEALRGWSYEPPVAFDQDGTAGWTQPLPVDGTLTVAHRRANAELWITTARGSDGGECRRSASQRLDQAIARGADDLAKANSKWWSVYWADAPTVKIPDESMSFIYHYGMYKFAGLTNPTGIAATLQGPWIEEYQLPPWSSDYHFNINVQMCYMPAYAGNRLEHLVPLFDLVWSWRDLLRENARKFIGIDDGFLLPHAVDDRGTCMGGFWTGTIDHACTAWVAKMMFDYWNFGGAGGIGFLRDCAYPFMVGAMRVYEEMLERDGETFSLPVSVSPEYRGSAMNAWGKNASWQLASVHNLLESLQRASVELKVPPRPIWAEIQQKLPRASLASLAGHEQIMLWEGTRLEESHRHHAHLGGITPFDVFDLADPKWKSVVENSVRNWIFKGMGEWSGWCVPWASQIHARMGNVDMAVLALELWRRVFTNEGQGTLHDAHFDGFTLVRWMKKEVMQIEAGMAAAVAVMDLLVHVRRGVHHLFAGAPAAWNDVSFSGIRTEGGFLVSAGRLNGEIRLIHVQSTRGGIFKLQKPWQNTAIAEVDGQSIASDEPIISIAVPAGSTAIFWPG